MNYCAPYADITWRNDDTPESQMHGDIYYPEGRGIEAAEHVFLKPNGVLERWRKKVDPFTIGELGFGTGLNFFLTAKHWIESGRTSRWLHFLSFEKTPLRPEDIRRAMFSYPELTSLVEDLLSRLAPPLAGFQRINFIDHAISLTLIYSEASAGLKNLISGKGIDAWYLDGFAPSQNPDMWTADIARLLATHSAPDATFGTFSAAGSVRRGLEAAGFNVEKFEGFSGKRESLRGALQNAKENYQSASPPKSVAIIGGGLAGICVAKALSLRGIHTHLVERENAIAQGASGNPAGVLLPYITANPTIPSRFYLKAFHFALNLYPENLLQRQPIVHFPSTDRLLKLLGQFDLTELPHEIALPVSKETLRKEFSLNATSDAFLYPKGAWVRPGEICNDLLKSCGELNHLSIGTEAIKLTQNNSSWIISNEAGEEICTTEALVLTSAFDVKQFQQSAWLPVEAVRGQLVQTGEIESSKSLGAILCYDGYCLPSDNGLHTLGASYSHFNLSPEPDEADSEDIITRIVKWCPELRFNNIPFATRVAFRTTTYDRFPFVGALPDYEASLSSGQIEHHKNLFVATGFGSRGLISCPLSAEILASIMCNEIMPVENDIHQAMLPERFVKRCIEKDARKKG